MRVRPHLRRIRVLAVVVDTPSESVVAVESTVAWLRCPYCGFKCRWVHDRRNKGVHDPEMSGRQTTLVWHRRCGSELSDAVLPGPHRLTPLH